MPRSIHTTRRDDHRQRRFRYADEDGDEAQEALALIRGELDRKWRIKG